MTPVFTFTKTDTQAAKGGAVTLMLFHHLFSYSKIPLPYFTLLPSHPVKVIQVFSQFGNICIAVFLLLTGYGLYFVSQKKDMKAWTANHALTFIRKYVCVFILFVPAGFLFFGREFHGWEFIQNLACLKFTYNEEWWFVRLYLEILLLAPFIAAILKKRPGPCLAGSLLLSAAGLIMRLVLLDSSWVFGELSGLFMWQLMFTTGWVCARYELFIKFQAYLWKHNLNKWYLYLILLLAIILIRQEPYLPAKLKDPLLAPLFTVSSVCLFKAFHLSKLFAYLGRHSANMWLVHTFFCYYYFMDLVFFPYFAPLILIWLILLSLGASYIIMGMEHFIWKGWKRSKICLKKPANP